MKPKPSRYSRDLAPARHRLLRRRDREKQRGQDLARVEAERQAEAERQLKSALRLWWGCVVVVGCWVMFVVPLLAAAHLLLPGASADARFMTIVMGGCVLPLAWRLAQLRPASLSPETAADFAYIEWRKAMQKPMESSAAIVLYVGVAILAAATGLDGTELQQVSFAILVLVSWALVPGLIGTTGADIDAWRAKKGPRADPVPADNSLFWVVAVIYLAIVVVGFVLGGRSSPPTLRVDCAPVSLPHAIGQVRPYQCIPSSGSTIPAIGTPHGEVSYPSVKCSAAPARRDAAGVLPPTTPAYACEEQA